MKLQTFQQFIFVLILQEGKNRALVDSDNENVVSDSSADEESNLEEMVDIIQTKGH